jgi:phosphoribosylformylglycinamidine cyclo-ligase
MSERRAPTAGLSYSDAGVDRDTAARAKRGILELVQRTNTPGVLSVPGGFGGLFRVPAEYRAPVLVSSADGVGTKLKVAMRAGRHDTVGADLVNHCVDDILVEGARPLFFLDYIGMGKLEAGTVDALVQGLSDACIANGCALLGGETAEMPDFYDPGEYDLAGFIVGIVEEDGRPGAHRVRPGDALVALASSGFHTNGYSLLRRLLFDRLALDLDAGYPGTGRTVEQVLLAPHRSYLHAVHPLIREGRIHALAHITGGGLPENLVRVLPAGVSATIDTSSWTVPPEFAFVMDAGSVSYDEMFLTFNMGVGMVLAVAPEDADAIVRALTEAGEAAWIAGATAPGEREVVLSHG